MSKAVITTSYGVNSAVFDKLKNSMDHYAEKIQADFIIMDDKYFDAYPEYQVFQLYDYFKKYKRIIYFSPDVYVRDDCPDLTDIVPNYELGVYDEGEYINRQDVLQDICKKNKVSISKWSGEFFDTSVMVLSRVHRTFFKRPQEEIDEYAGQKIGPAGWLNYKIIQSGCDICRISEAYNFDIKLHEKSQMHKLSHYILNYKGIDIDQKEDMIIEDMADLEKAKPYYSFPQKIYVELKGSLREKINAIPTISYLTHYVHAGDDVYVYGAGEIAEDLYKYGVRKVYPGPLEEKGYSVLTNIPDEGSPLWHTVNPDFCHIQDFTLLAMTGRLLPEGYHQYYLPIDLGKIASFKNEHKIKDLISAVVVNMGYESKEYMPDYFFKELFEKLGEQDRGVILIGEYPEDIKIHENIEIPDNFYDFRGLLDYEGLKVVLSQANILITDDSLPLAVAGGYDNHIILIPIQKNDSYILPVRKGTQSRKTYVPSRINYAESVRTLQPGSYSSSLTIDKLLPSVDDVLEQVIKIEELSK